MKIRGKNDSVWVSIVGLLITGVLLTGYVKNIVKLCKCDFEPSYKAEVIHSIGVVTGLGAIIGYIDLGK